MKKIHLVIPMSGQGVRFKEAGFLEPKPLIPVNGRPIIQRLLEVFPEHWDTHFILAENHWETELPKYLTSLRPNSRIYALPQHKLGPSFAILKAMDEIPDDEAVFVSYCDYGMSWDHSAFEQFVTTSQCDACIVSYRGFHAHYLNPLTYAFSRMEGERVVEVKEKGSFTDNRENEFASSGGYYFTSKKILQEAISYQMQKEHLCHKGEYYTSLTVQALLELHHDSHVRIFEIPYFYQWGTPSDLSNFIYWEKTFANLNHFLGAPSSEVDQVLMPMAGLGSRFEKEFSLPKPLIPVNHSPMFVRALESLPQAKNNVIIALQKIREKLPTLPNTLFHLLEETPKGQALSTKTGIPFLQKNKDLVISSCDHGIVLDPKNWKRFRENPHCDAGIFTMQGIPSSERRPNAFAYVVPEISTKDEFPLVEKVSVKVPVSSTPIKDNVLVGTFWFRNPDILQTGIELLEKRNMQVNGELYLDSIFTLLSEMGFKVRMIPLDGYIGWGDPDSLNESLYWQEVFLGHRIEPRRRIGC